MRASKTERKTNETNISVELNLDGTGKFEIKTPIGFLTHMLESFAKHGAFDIKMSIEGDLQVDQHHTIEDAGLVLGQSFKQALGDKLGINRAGYFAFPMDDSLAVVAVDIASRPYLKFNADFTNRFCGELDTELVEDFFYAFSVGLQANIAINLPFGRNDHHKIEAIFKAFGKAMKMACSKDARMIEEIPSTKGII